ncbi:potassium channel family protein [Sedimentitalea sp. HM32M-2]|uniref:potassium channel family protein n=1 Tax=Sedimentitalea sp. HM32M-2 TaxID=3351566 RepID=UPI003629501B
MSLAEQIFWGSSFLGLCMFLHVVCLALCAQMLTNVADRTASLHPALHIGLSMALTLVVLILALTIQVWIWSLVWIGYGILPDWNTAVYFSMVTFTTLGYGDVVLGPEARIFATFGSVTGLLGFGLSTAFLVAIAGRVLQKVLQDDQSSGANKRANGAP